MSIGPISAPQRTSTPSPTREVSRSPASTPHPDAKALADEFSAAARRGQLPLGGKGLPTAKDGKPLRLGPDGKPLPAPTMTTAKSLGYGKGQGQDSLSETRRDDSALSTQLLGQSPLSGAGAMQAPQPVAAHVDPSVFADMLTNIWTREQNKTAREVRVSFGDEAWPATGATLLRLDDGSLRVTVSVGRRGADLGSGLDDLRDRMNARGLNVADIAVETD